jgi:hypothetical protein
MKHELEVLEDVKASTLSVLLEQPDDGSGETESCPQMGDDFPNSFRVVGQTELLAERLLDVLGVLRRQLDVELPSLLLWRNGCLRPGTNMRSTCDPCQ